MGATEQDALCKRSYRLIAAMYSSEAMFRCQGELPNLYSSAAANDFPVLASRRLIIKPV